MAISLINIPLNLINITYCYYICPVVNEHVRVVKEYVNDVKNIFSDDFFTDRFVKKKTVFVP